MSATEEIEKWIAEHGNVRDALNVAITRLRAEERIAQLVEEIDEMNMHLTLGILASLRQLPTPQLGV